MPFPPVRERIKVRSHSAEQAARLAAELSVPPLVARVLAARGFADAGECRRFFAPDPANLADPFLFAQMPAAVERIRAAIERREKITVYGDYDVDGVTGTAMLTQVLRRLGAECAWYLPNRLTEGYGISAEAVKTIAADGTKLIVSTDCGIGAAEEVAAAAALGVDTIVTDHHEHHGAVPRPYALLDPKAPECGYPDRDLAGVGVALKLCQALCMRLAPEKPFWRDYLDLVAVGTAADIVPLVGENRIIVAAGLEVLRKGGNPGLAALVREQGLDAADLATHHVVFQLAPCINAAGRLGDPRRAVELLLTDDPGLASACARELAMANRERRSINEQVAGEAVRWVEQHCDPGRDMAIVAGSENWHRGVVGIVASKLVERFYRPVLLFSVSDGVAHGSGRSVPGLHLLETLAECGDLFESYGGHAAAAGVCLPADRLDALRERFNAAVRKRLAPEDLAPAITADTEARLDELTGEALEHLERMRPFGPGNMRPVIVCRGLALQREPRVVGGSHLKMTVRGQAGACMDAIAFGFGERFDEVRRSRSLALAFNLDRNEYNGRTSLQMRVKGVET